MCQDIGQEGLNELYRDDCEGILAALVLFNSARKAEVQAHVVQRTQRISLQCTQAQFSGKYKHVFHLHFKYVLANSLLRSMN